jgi:hypothetical protein
MSSRILTTAFAAALAMLTPAKAADAGSKRLSLGEVAVLQPAAASMTSALKSVLETEMSGLDLRGTRKDAILSASLVKLDAEHERGLVSSASCVISVTLRSRDGGVLFAVLEGRARAQGSSDHVPESALRGAVHGALARVPEALK